MAAASAEKSRRIISKHSHLHFAILHQSALTPSLSSKSPKFQISFARPRKMLDAVKPSHHVSAIDSMLHIQTHCLLCTVSTFAK